MSREEIHSDTMAIVTVVMWCSTSHIYIYQAPSSCRQLAVHRARSANNSTCSPQGRVLNQVPLFQEGGMVSWATARAVDSWQGRLWHSVTGLEGRRSSGSGLHPPLCCCRYVGPAPQMHYVCASLQWRLLPTGLSWGVWHICWPPTTPPHYSIITASVSTTSVCRKHTHWWWQGWCSSFASAVQPSACY